MRATSTQYAKALYEATKDKNQNKVDGVLANFVKTVDQNRQLRLKDQIIKKFGEVYNGENGIVEAEVTSREELDEKTKSYVRTYVHTKYKAKEVVLKNIISENIKGGIIIRVGDEVMDFSVERQLKELKNKLIS